jgi:hypothetical protein
MSLRGLGLDKTLVVSLGRNQAVMAAGWHSMAWTCRGVAGVRPDRGALLRLQRRRRAGDLAEARQRAAAAAEKVELALNGANLGLWDWQMVDDVRTSWPRRRHAGLPAKS